MNQTTTKRGPLIPPPDTTDKLAIRAYYVEQITDLLDTGPMSAPELIELTGVIRSTMHSYLRYMEQTLLKVRRSGERKDRQVLWEIGISPELGNSDDEDLLAIAPKRPVAPAEQVGMWRDGLVAALFGAPWREMAC
jgi:hypothetical protein